MSSTLLYFCPTLGEWSHEFLVDQQTCGSASPFSLGSGTQPRGPVLRLARAVAPVPIPPWVPQLLIPNFQPCGTPDLQLDLQRWLIKESEQTWRHWRGLKHHCSCLCRKVYKSWPSHEVPSSGLSAEPLGGQELAWEKELWSAALKCLHVWCPWGWWEYKEPTTSSCGPCCLSQRSLLFFLPQTALSELGWFCYQKQFPAYKITPLFFSSRSLLSWQIWPKIPLPHP